MKYVKNIIKNWVFIKVFNENMDRTSFSNFLANGLTQPFVNMLHLLYVKARNTLLKRLIIESV